MEKRIGLIGSGRIGAYVYERCVKNGRIGVDFVYEPDKNKTSSLDRRILLDNPKDIFDRRVDLVVEAANPQVVVDYGPRVLESNDILVLSVTAFADAGVEHRFAKAAADNRTRVYIPHGAMLGIDGVYDARHTLEKVEVTTVKNPRNIDFDASGGLRPEDIKDRTTLYKGPTRAVCSKFPRNVNAHAIVALAGIGFDRTTSILIADPFLKEAVQLIHAEGEGVTLEISRSSPIKGVTGDYTLASIYGSVERALLSAHGFNIL